MAHPTARPSSARQTPALGSIVLTLLLVAVLGLVGAVTVAPRLVGAAPLAVSTDQMQPTLARGDLAVVRPVPIDQLEVGDVVAFRPVPGSGEVVTHRLVDIDLEYDGSVRLQTQGDSSPYPDPSFTADQLQGRVAYTVPYLGRVAQEPWVLAAVTLGGVLLVGGAAVALLGPGAPARRAGTPSWAARETEHAHG